MSENRGANSKVCLQCDEPAHSRGLCNTHYKQVTRSIERGIISERNAIRSGLILPKAQTGPQSGRKLAKKIAKVAGKLKRATR